MSPVAPVNQPKTVAAPPAPDATDSKPVPVKESGNDIGWAVDAAKAGKEVTRAQWAGNAFMSYFRPTARKPDGKLHYTHVGDVLQLTNHLGSVAPFVLSIEDIMATDWLEVEVPEEEEVLD